MATQASRTTTTSKTSTGSAKKTPATSKTTPTKSTPTTATVNAPAKTKSAAASKAASDKVETISSEAFHKMVAEAAYYIAQKDGHRGDEYGYWLQGCEQILNQIG